MRDRFSNEYTNNKYMSSLNRGSIVRIKLIYVSFKLKNTRLFTKNVVIIY